MKTKLNLLPVGSKVIIKSLIHKEYDGNNRKWVSDEEVRNKLLRGIVTGYSYRCDGIYNSGGSSGMYGEDYDPPYLAVTKKHVVILVRLWAWGPEFPTFPQNVSLMWNDGWSLPMRRGQ